MKELEIFLKPTQEKLFKNIRRWLCKMNAKHYYCKKKYILVKGEAPVMLVAHMDTVHRHPVKHICKTEDGNILMSPQGIGGDDRCGVYALVNAYEMSPVKPWLLFTCDEEIGGVGAEAFCDDYLKEKLPEALDTLKFIIEIDRRGKNDAVYYSCANKEFEEYVTSKGFETQQGSFSDISYIAPDLGVAAVNLSSGYYNAHTEHEYIVRSEIDAVIEAVVQMVGEAVQPDFPKYKWVECAKVYAPVSSWGAYSGLKPRAGFRYYGDSDSLPKDLPAKIKWEYEDLLELYDIDELESLRYAYGDEIITELYNLEMRGVDSRSAYLGGEEEDECVNMR